MIKKRTKLVAFRIKETDEKVVRSLVKKFLEKKKYKLYNKNKNEKRT